MSRLATADLLGVLHSTLIEDVTVAGRSRENTRREVVNKWLEERTGAPPQQRPSAPPDPATWGLAPEQQAAMKAAMKGVPG